MTLIQITQKYSDRLIYNLLFIAMARHPRQLAVARAVS